MKLKHGSAILKIKETGSAGAIAGYGSVFGNVDSHGEIVERGAFTKSLARHSDAGTRPKMFWQHDNWKPIGSWRSWKEDETGLYLEGQINMNVRQGAEAFELLSAGDIDGLSIGYREISVKQSGSVTRLTELDLMEVSIVSIGSNPRATVDSVKALFREGHLPSLKEFEAHLREAGCSKTQATAIANHGLSKLLRSESVGEPDAAELFARIMANVT